jgi:hypothetical protein
VRIFQVKREEDEGAETCAFAGETQTGDKRSE